MVISVDKIKRKFRILLSKGPIFNVRFGQNFLRSSVKLLHRPRAFGFERLTPGEKKRNADEEI